MAAVNPQIPDALPDGIRIDPRRGPAGAVYVLITCPVCGRGRRESLARLRARHGKEVEA